MSNIQEFIYYWQNKDTGKEKGLEKAYNNAFMQAEKEHGEVIRRLDFLQKDGVVTPVFPSTVNGLVDNYISVLCRLSLNSLNINIVL